MRKFWWLTIQMGLGSISKSMWKGMKSCDKSFILEKLQPFSFDRLPVKLFLLKVIMLTIMDGTQV